MISDVSYGGASFGARRLFSALKEAPKLSMHWVIASGPALTGAGIADHKALFSVLLRCHLAIRRRSTDKDKHKALLGMNEANVLSQVHRLNPDCILLQNIHESMSFNLVASLPKDLPIVWTLRDMWPLTGYCCYSYECRKYLEGCRGACPQMNQWGIPLNHPDSEWDRRTAFFEANRHRLVLAAPSQWLVDCVRSRMGEGYRTEYIPNSVDLTEFVPLGPRSVIKAMLGFNPQEPLILAGAHSIHEERKGAKYLLDAVDLLRKKIGRVSVAVYGSGVIEGYDDVTSFGSVMDARFLNLLYNAADVFVLPSLAENAANTLIEATAAGTPSVAFDIGGCPELVRDGLTGFIAKYKDVNDLAACIERLVVMSDAEKLKMREDCRRFAERNYSFKLQGERYAQVIRNICHL